MSDINKVGVLGCGLMGSGIAQVAAQAGYETVVREVEQKFLDKGLAGIDKSLGKFVEKGKLQAADKDACIIDHEKAVNVQAQHVVDHLGGRRLGSHRENRRRHQVAHARLVDVFHLEAFDRPAFACV